MISCMYIDDLWKFVAQFANLLRELMSTGKCENVTQYFSEASRASIAEDI